MWSISVHIPWELEKNVHSAIAGSRWRMVLFRSAMPIPIPCLLHLSVTDGGMLKSPGVVGGLSIFSFSAQFFAFFKLLLGIYTASTATFLGKLIPLPLHDAPLYPWAASVLQGLLCQKLIELFQLPLMGVSLVFLSLFLYFFSNLVFLFKLCFLWTTCRCVFFSIHSDTV